MIEAKTIGKALGGILLTFFILSAVFVYGLSQVTSYDSLEPAFSRTISEQLSPQLSGNIDEFRLYTNEECKKSDKINLTITDSPLLIDCSEMKNVTNDKLVNYLSEKVFDQFYYKDYKCNDISCFKKVFSKDPQELAVVISAQMNSLLKSIIIYLLLGIILSIIIIIISVRKTFSIMKNIGTTFLVSGLAFIFLLFSKYFIPSAEGAIGELINSIVNTFTYLYGIVFVIGIILTVVGYIGEKYSSETMEQGKRSGHSERAEAERVHSSEQHTKKHNNKKKSAKK